MLAITNPVEGLMVYCTTCSVKSLFAYSGADWLNLVNGLVDSSLSSNGTAGVSAYSSISSAGTLTAGTAVSGVTQTISATVSTQGGTYAITTGAINGVTFAGSGNFPAGGSQDIVLTATGTPTAVGTNSFALNTSPSISFARETIDPSSAVASYVSKASAGTMTVGTAASGVTQTITANVTRVGSYNISTTAINGITFASIGSYSATGNQDVTLTASGTPSAVGTFSHAISGSPTVSFSRVVFSQGDATFASLPMDRSVNSLNNGGSSDVQGVIDNGSNKITYSIPYASGTGSYAAYTSASVAVNGQAGDNNNLTLTYPAGTFSSSGNIIATVVVDGDGTFNVEKIASGTTKLIGTLAFAVNGANKGNVTLTTVTNTVTSTTGKVWMDKNLGATFVALSSTDPQSYGDLYQWGRGKDGHQIRTSANSALNATSSTDNPGNGNFIIVNSGSLDWRSPQNNDLWQGVNGTNNPCPVGFRVPTSTELSAEIANFSPQNSDGAFSSPLKLPMAGTRNLSSGSLRDVGGVGNYWSSTVDGTSAIDLYFNSSVAGVGTDLRASGFSVRCLKD
jgi:hypothetical protein